MSRVIPAKGRRGVQTSDDDNLRIFSLFLFFVLLVILGGGGGGGGGGRGRGGGGGVTGEK